MAKLDTSKQNLISKIDELFGFNLSNKTDGVAYDFGQYKLNKLYKPLVKYFIEQLMLHLENYTDQEAEKILGLFTDFYSLYYSNGDFGYFKNKFSTYQYRIPYSGKDTEFWWATKDCYYVKTSDVVNDMSVSVGGLFEGRELSLKLFKETHAETNDSGEDKYNFDIRVEEIIDEDSEEITGYKVVFVNYEESKDNKKQKDTKVKESLEQKGIDHGNPGVKKTIDEFLKKRGRDYFIHKRLKSFLAEELERYFFQMLKNDIQAKADIIGIQKKIEEVKAKYSDDPAVIEFKIGQLMKESGKDLKLSVYETAYLWILNYANILGDLEEFKAKLWNKKRKIIKQEYCITIGKIIEYETLTPRKNDILKEILSNKDQLKEREELLAEGNNYLGKITLVGIKDELQIGMINMATNMVVDTKRFDKSSKLYQTLHERGQKKLYEEGAKLDGLMMKSENYQGLNHWLEEYRNQVQGIYIDPPFNLGENGDFMYKTDYLDGSWSSLLSDRYNVAYQLLKDSGSIFTRCDYNGNGIVGELLGEVFGYEYFRNEIVVNRGKQRLGGINKYANATDTLFFYGKSDNQLFFPYKRERYIGEAKGTNMLMKGERNPRERKFIDPEGNEVILIPPPNTHRKFIQPKIDILYKKGVVYFAKSQKGLQSGIVKVEGDGTLTPVDYVPSFTFDDDKTIDTNRTDISGYSADRGFPTENSEPLLKRVMITSTTKNNIFLDYFMGSATTQAVAQKLGRKWLGLEIGDQFEKHDIPRLKAVLQGKESGISKGKDVIYQGGGYFSYQYLNQYEDRFNDDGYLSKVDGDINHLSNTDLSTIGDIKQILYPLSQLKDRIYGLDDEIIQG